MTWMDENIAFIRRRHPAIADDLARQAAEGFAATLILVRHAHVAVDPTIPSREWRLSAEGRAATAVLATDPALAGVAVVASSPERKAMSTAEMLAAGRPIVPVPDLRELDRRSLGWVGDGADYEAMVDEIFRRPDESVRGCEPATAAQMRVIKAIDDLVAAHHGEKVVVVSHGLVLSLYVAHLNGADQLPIDIWRHIAFPDLALVDPRWRYLISGFQGREGASYHGMLLLVPHPCLPLMHM